jgi:hypothetical protein
MNDISMINGLNPNYIEYLDKYHMYSVSILGSFNRKDLKFILDYKREKLSNFINNSIIQIYY